MNELGRTLSFLSAAKPSDLGMLGVLILVVGGGGDHFWLLMCRFSEVYSKVTRFFLSSQNLSNTFEGCVQELPDF